MCLILYPGDSSCSRPINNHRLLCEGHLFSCQTSMHNSTFCRPLSTLSTLNTQQIVNTPPTQPPLGLEQEGGQGPECKQRSTGNGCSPRHPGPDLSTPLLFISLCPATHSVPWGHVGHCEPPHFYSFTSQPLPLPTTRNMSCKTARLCFSLSTFCISKTAEGWKFIFYDKLNNASRSWKCCRWLTFTVHIWFDLMLLVWTGCQPLFHLLRKEFCEHKT